MISNIANPSRVRCFVATAVIWVLLAPAARFGSSVDDANAGIDALNRGDYATTVRLFTLALREGRPFRFRSGTRLR
jgi:hypothetical protein